MLPPNMKRNNNGKTLSMKSMKYVDSKNYRSK